MAKETDENGAVQRRARTVVRVGACLAAAVCALLAARAPFLSGLVPSLSPFNALLAVAAGTGGIFLIGAAVVAAACCAAQRFFCRWLCPAGTCQDAVARISKKRAWVARVPSVGAWLLFAGVGAALAGYPLFGWLDPLALFNAAAGAAHARPAPLEWAAASGFALLLALALVAPGLWCGRLCPLGALQDLLRRPFARRREPETAAREVAAVGRRAFIGLGLGAGYRIALPPCRKPSAPVLRPPSSGAPARFTRLCVRCGACVRVCPSGILSFGGADAGWAGVLAPEVSFADGYCQETCAACGRACPSGAIAPFTLKTKFRWPLGVARMDYDRCVLGLRRECGACVNACPYEALDFEWDPDEMSSRVKVDEKRCTGCGYCEYVCVTTPRSITVEPLRGG